MVVERFYPLLTQQIDPVAPGTSVGPIAPAKSQVPLGDGTPVSATALLADSSFYGFGTPAERTLASGMNNGVGISFDAAEFDIQGRKGEVYSSPITGEFRISDRVRLDYVIPLQYIKLSDEELFQGGPGSQSSYQPCPPLGCSALVLGC